MEKLDFGTKLIEVRKAKGLTQDEVAEKCNITVRTIQRIESGLVTPRAFTIKIISETLGFDFYETSQTDNKVLTENQNSNSENHRFLWYLKDLINLKTNTMKKISILSTSVLLIILALNLFTANAQSDIVKNKKSLIISMNKDKAVNRVEAVFKRNLTLDSLVQIKNDLQKIGITLHYKKIEFDIHNLLLNLDCQVIGNDGFSGSFGTGDLSIRNRNERIGFFRDYTPNCKIPFATGSLEDK